MNIWILEMKTTTLQNIIEPIKNNKGLQIVFAAIIAADYPVTFQIGKDESSVKQLYPMFYEQDMEEFISEIPNLFVFIGDYPHFAITTQAGVKNIIEKQQDFILEEVDNSKYIMIPLTEFLNNIEQKSEAEADYLNPVSFVKTLVLELSDVIANQFWGQDFDNKDLWAKVQNPDAEQDWKYIAAVSNRISALCELLDLIKSNEDLILFIEKQQSWMMNK